MKIESIDLLGIETLTVTGNASDVGIIMLHGYGANMQDLFPLWELWHAEKFNWYFPNGVLPLNMGYYEGRSWFSIDVQELERAMREGRPRNMRGTLPLEFDSTLALLTPYIDEISKKHKTIIVGGFSQGAMCASHLAMNSSLSIDGLILLSGALIAEARCPAQVKGIPFYQSHGVKDPILDFQAGKELEEKLLSLNFSGKLHPFQGGHEIPTGVIHEVREFLGQFA